MSELEKVKHEENLPERKILHPALFAVQGIMTIAAAFGLGLAAVYILAGAALTLSFFGNLLAFAFVFAAFVWMMLKPALHGKVQSRMAPDPVDETDETPQKFLP